MSCQHTTTTGRAGEVGQWCASCGEKVWDVDTRKCKDCRHFSAAPSGGICKHHLCGALPDMSPSYEISKGSCWRTKVYGCHNRAPLKDEAMVQSGWDWTFAGRNQVRRIAIIPDPMSKECRYTHTDLGRVDERCSGCKHRAEPSAKDVEEKARQ